MSVEEEVLEGARILASQLLDLVSVDRARELLSAEAVKRANLEADVAEVVKFRGEKT